MISLAEAWKLLSGALDINWWGEQRWRSQSYSERLGVVEGDRPGAQRKRDSKGFPNTWWMMTFGDSAGDTPSWCWAVFSFVASSPLPLFPSQASGLFKHYKLEQALLSLSCSHSSEQRRAGESRKSSCDVLRSYWGKPGAGVEDWIVEVIKHDSRASKS